MSIYSQSKCLFQDSCNFLHNVKVISPHKQKSFQPSLIDVHSHNITTNMSTTPPSECGSPLSEQWRETFFTGVIQWHRQFCNSHSSSVDSLLAHWRRPIGSLKICLVFSHTWMPQSSTQTLDPSCSTALSSHLASVLGAPRHLILTIAQWLCLMPFPQLSYFSIFK